MGKKNSQRDGIVRDSNGNATTYYIMTSDGVTGCKTREGERI